MINNKSVKLFNYCLIYHLIYLFLSLFLGIFSLYFGLPSFPFITILMVVLPAVYVGSRFIKKEKRFLLKNEVYKLTIYCYIFHVCIQILGASMIIDYDQLSSSVLILTLISFLFELLAIYLVYKFIHIKFPLPS